MDKSSAIIYRNNLLKDMIEPYDLKHCGKKDKNATKNICSKLGCHELQKNVFHMMIFLYPIVSSFYSKSNIF